MEYSWRSYATDLALVKNGGTIKILRCTVFIKLLSVLLSEWSLCGASYGGSDRHKTNLGMFAALHLLLRNSSDTFWMQVLKFPFIANKEKVFRTCFLSASLKRRVLQWNQSELRSDFSDDSAINCGIFIACIGFSLSNRFSGRPFPSEAYARGDLLKVMMNIIWKYSLKVFLRNLLKLRRYMAIFLFIVHPKYMKPKSHCP